MNVHSANERKAGRPTLEETSRLNEEILQAAFEVFVREGFGGASIERIAQESQTTRRSVLNRFPDKESLLFAVVEMGLRRMQKGLDLTEAELASKPVETLKAACRRLLHVAVDREATKFFYLCLAHASRFPEITTITMRRNDIWLADLESLIQRAQRIGAFQGRDPAMLATGLIGAFMSNPANRAALGDPQFHEPTALGRYFDGMWSLIADML